jgi:hypothetical protein
VGVKVVSEPHIQIGQDRIRVASSAPGSCLLYLDADFSPYPALVAVILVILGVGSGFYCFVEWWYCFSTTGTIVIANILAIFLLGLITFTPRGNCNPGTIPVPGLMVQGT